MTRISTLALAMTATALTATIAEAADVQTTIMKTHPSQGEVTEVKGTRAELVRDADGVFAAVETMNLTPGHVHTLWFVAINNPTACATAPCTSKDVLKSAELVQADVGYAGGIIANEDGTGQFAWRQREGDLNGAWFTAGLMSSEHAEIHLAINDHGPILEGREAAMLGSYRDGCADESIPGPMPATARADGEAGPNTCRLVQFTIFEVPGANS